MIDHCGRHEAILGATGDAIGIGAEMTGAEPHPGSQLVELVNRIVARLAFGTVFGILGFLVVLAVARRINEDWATVLSAGCCW